MTYDADPEYQRLIGEYHINRINHLRSFKQKMDAFTKSKIPVEKKAALIQEAIEKIAAIEPGLIGSTMDMTDSNPVERKARFDELTKHFGKHRLITSKGKQFKAWGNTSSIEDKAK
jgi:hypothetical protein